MTRKLLAEALGTAFLLMGVVGSGIMAETLSPDNTGVALLANAIATGGILYVIITIFAPVSGAHFNPAVTFTFWLKGDVPMHEAALYCLVQIWAAILGVWIAHVMFEEQILQLSSTLRTGPSQWVSEVVASFGLVLLILGGIKHAPERIAALVAAYITGAYWFTSSTSFANPAVTIARSLTDTFAGIHPANMPLFIVMQLVGAALALAMARVVFARN